MRRHPLVGRSTVVLALVVGLATTGCASGSDTTIGSSSAPPVAADSLVTVGRDGRIVVTDRAGQRIDELGRVGDDRIQEATVALSPDRRRLLVGLAGPPDCASTVVGITTDGRQSTFAEHALAPVWLPGERVAMVKLEEVDGFCRGSAIVIADAQGDVLAEHPVPNSPRTGDPSFSPTRQVIAASPDGETIALVRERSLQFLAVGTGTWTTGDTDDRRLYAPAYADDGKLVVQFNCCLTGMSLLEIEDPFPRIITLLTVPVISIDAGATADELVLVNALHEVQLVVDGEIQPPIASSVLAVAAT